MRFLIKLAVRLLPNTMAMCRNFKRLALDVGQWRSIKGRVAVDGAGEPIPWYTYSAIEYLQSFDFNDCDVFEFGSGNSSLFWAGKSRSVVSVEDNANWFGHVSANLYRNQTVIHRTHEDEYVASLSAQCRLFDVIVIDGSWRKNCAAEAVKFLKPGGMIILDNSDWFRESGRLLLEQGFFQIDFSGYGPINDYNWTTSLFVKMPTTLQRNFSGPSPIGGLKHIGD